MMRSAGSVSARMKISASVRDQRPNPAAPTSKTPKPHLTKGGLSKAIVPDS